MEADVGDQGKLQCRMDQIHFVIDDRCRALRFAKLISGLLELSFKVCGCGQRVLTEQIQGNSREESNP